MGSDQPSGVGLVRLVAGTTAPLPYITVHERERRRMEWIVGLVSLLLGFGIGAFFFIGSGHDACDVDAALEYEQTRRRLAEAEVKELKAARSKRAGQESRQVKAARAQAQLLQAKLDAIAEKHPTTTKRVLDEFDRRIEEQRESERLVRLQDESVDLNSYLAGWPLVL